MELTQAHIDRARSVGTCGEGNYAVGTLVCDIDSYHLEWAEKVEVVRRDGAVDIARELAEHLGVVAEIWSIRWALLGRDGEGCILGGICGYGFGNTYGYGAGNFYGDGYGDTYGYEDDSGFADGYGNDKEKG